MNLFLLRWVAVLVCFAGFYSTQVPDDFQIPDPLSGADHQLADQLTSSISNSEWLGVLAPIAISPFFGITCLAGMSQFGGELLGTNSFVSSNPVLNNPAVFWVFLTLTLLTSLPRMTKVSKPIAQACDQVEACSGIITLLVIRFVGASAVEAEPTAAVVMQMGVLSFTSDMLLSVAAILNIIVINSVKFFFEILVWLVPFPFVDAMLEVANKAVCAALMAIYAFSPTIAMGLNLLMFTICLVLYFWVRRRIVYARSILGDPVVGMLSKSYSEPRKPELIIFPHGGYLVFSSKLKLMMQPVESGWRMTRKVWFLPAKSIEISSENQVQIKPGLLMNQLVITGPEAGTFTFSRRYSGRLDELATSMNFELVEEDSGELAIDLDFAG